MSKDCHMGDRSWSGCHCPNCAAELRAEVERLRDRERRVVRVFWRVRYTHDGMSAHDDFRTREGCKFFMNCFVPLSGFRVYRVTVRRVAKTGRDG